MNLLQMPCMVTQDQKNQILTSQKNEDVFSFEYKKDLTKVYSDPKAHNGQNIVGQK